MLVNAVLILLPLGTWLASEPPMDPKESRGEVQERYSLSCLDRACLTQHTHARLSFAFYSLSGRRDVPENSGLQCALDSKLKN